MQENTEALQTFECVTEGMDLEEDEIERCREYFNSNNKRGF